MPLLFAPVADPDDLQILPEPDAHALDHVGGERALGPVQRLDDAFVAGAEERQNVALDLDVDRRMDVAAQLALGSLDQQGAAVDARLHLVRKNDGIFSYTRHGITRP